MHGSLLQAVFGSSEHGKEVDVVPVSYKYGVVKVICVFGQSHFNYVHNLPAFAIRVWASMTFLSTSLKYSARFFLYFFQRVHWSYSSG